MGDGVDRKRSLLVGADRGGCGKTFITAAIAVAVRDMGGDPSLVEYEVDARLGRMLSRDGIAVETRAPGVTAVDVARDKKAAEKFWDHLSVGELMEGGRIYDTAANALSQALAAMGMLDVQRRIDGGSRTGFVVSATTEGHALRAAPGLVRQIRDAFPKAPVWLVLNERDGSFERVGNAAFTELVESGTVTPVQIPAFNDELASSITAYPMSRLRDLGEDGLLKMFPDAMNWAEAARLETRLAKFVADVMVAVQPIAGWFVHGDGWSFRPRTA